MLQGGKPLDVSGGVTEKMPLPFLVGLEVVVTDSAGEQVVVAQDLKVTNNGGTTSWTSVAENIKSTQADNLDLKWKYYAFVANQAMRDAESGQTTERDAHDVNELIAREAANDVKEISSADTSSETISLMLGMTSTLERITYGTWNDAAVLQPASDALEYIQTKEDAFHLLSDYDSFNEGFLTALGNLMKYSVAMAESLVIVELTPLDELLSQLDRRELQLENIGEIPEIEDDDLSFEEQTELGKVRSLMKKYIVIKNKQLDLMCTKLTGYGTQNKETGPLITLIVSKISTASTSAPDIHFV